MMITSPKSRNERISYSKVDNKLSNLLFIVDKRILIELNDEWPELAQLTFKLINNEELNEKDKHNLKELAEASGWEISEVIDELKSINVYPEKRAEKYKNLFEIYFKEGNELKNKGDIKQAGEKVWGAVLALIKYYAAKKGIFIAHWSLGKIEKFVTDNVEKENKEIFRNLIDKAQRFHENFYENNLDEKTFEKRWKELMKYFGRVKSIVLE